MDIDEKILFGQGKEYELNHSYRYQGEFVSGTWFLLYYLKQQLNRNLIRLKRIISVQRGRQESEWYGWLQRRLQREREKYYLVNNAFHYIDKVRKTRMTEEEYFEILYWNYRKHLKNQGFQGYTGEKAIKVLKEYWTNLMRNIKMPKEIKRETKIGRIVKLEILGTKWGDREEIAKRPETYYYYEKKEGELRLSINFYEYLGRLRAETPKKDLINRRPKIKFYNGDSWEELD